jgi:hypothetical protein
VHWLVLSSTFASHWISPVPFVMNEMLWIMC